MPANSILQFFVQQIIQYVWINFTGSTQDNMEVKPSLD